ncbi:MAG: hypothetical protein KDK70_26905 [Myxococcales bacterium]|nr:hypothetical protein [Myxococcales bacterium]
MLALSLAEPMVVRGPVLTPPAEGHYALAPVVAVLLLVSLVGYIRRRRARAHAPRRAGVMARLALSAALGNALLELNALFDPSRPVAMVMERGDYERTPDGRGDGRDPEPRARSPELRAELSPPALGTGCDR